EFGRLLDRQIGRFFAMQDAAGIDSQLPVDARQARSIADQAAGGHELAPLIDRGNSMARRERDELLAADREERIGLDEQRAGLQLSHGREAGSKSASLPAFNT